MKIKKILLATAVSFAMILAALAILIKIYITPERLRAFLVPGAETALSRKVSIEEVGISLFKGIQVKDFVIKEADGKADFLKSKDFVLKYKFLPLLSRKVIIDELKILSPEITITRGKDGRFNFEDIGKHKPPEVRKEKETAEPAGLPVSLLISRLIFKDARFSFTDHKNELPDIKGTIDIDAGIESAGVAKLLSEGDIALSLDEIIIKKPRVRHIKGVTAGLTYRVSIDLETNSIRINRTGIKARKIAASVTGDVANLKTGHKVDISVSVPKTKTADILQSVKPFVDTKGIALSGEITADLKIEGMPEKPDTLKTDGNVVLEKVGVTYNNITAVLDGDLNFKKQSIDINLKSTINKSSAELQGSVSSYLKNRKIRLDLYSKSLFLNELVPAREQKTSQPLLKTGPASDKDGVKEAAPLDLGFSAEGEIKIDSAIYKDMNMDDFYIKYRFKKNRLEIPKMTALVGKGKFNLKSLIDLSKTGYAYNLSFRLGSVHADDLVNSFFPKAGNTVYGIISSDFKLDGAGTLPENIKKNLVADGDFDLSEGKITNSRLPENLAAFLGIKELRTINLKQANGTIKIRKGIARLDSIFSSDDISMDPTGSIGLDGTLDLAFDLKLSPQLTDRAMMKSGIAPYIKDEAGRGTIPLKVSGTFSDPSYGVDVAKAGKRVIKKKTKELIEDLLDKDKKEGEEKKDLKPIEDFLEKLF